jgi:predicted RNase H-like HicB family nuclease
MARSDKIRARCEMKRRRSFVYDVVLEPSEDGGYTVYVPALRGCVSQGETEDQALENIRDAILTWHATWQDIAAERKRLVRQVEVAV